jgi:uroporphyrinogen decarboxylase
MPKGGFFFDGSWLAMEYAWEKDFLKKTIAEAERLHKETDYFMVFRDFYSFFDSDIDYFCDMLTNPESVKAKNKASLKEQLESAALLIENMKDYVGAVCMSGDLGDQRSPMVKPEAFEAVTAPYLKVFCEFIHRNSDYKVFLHSCGSIEPLLPALIDCGIDIINPVQISAGNMEPEMLKRKYGKDIVFWGGGVDTQRVMSFKPPGEVAENAKQLIEVFKPGGGYVFCPVHNIMGDVAPENIVAAYDAAYEHSWY